MLCCSQCSKQAISLEEQTSTTGSTGQYNWLCSGYSLSSRLEMPHFHSGTVTDTPETVKENSTNPMCCLAATSGDICEEFKLAIIQNDSTAEINENTHTPRLKQRNVVESQTTSLKETSLQHPEPLRNSSENMKRLANKYCASITPRTVKMKPKERLTASQLKCDGDDNFSFLRKTSSTLLGIRLWEMGHGRAVYISVLHRSSWKVYQPLDFVNYLNTQPNWLVVY